jgi:hypothetical protein
MAVETSSSPRYAASGYAATYVTEKRERDELRGGGFLDDLERVRPYLPTSRTGGKDTAHFDLGFRIAGIVSESRLDKPLRTLLSLQPPASDTLWQEVAEAIKR